MRSFINIVVDNVLQLLQLLLLLCLDVEHLDLEFSLRGPRLIPECCELFLLLFALLDQFLVALARPVFPASLCLSLLAGHVVRADSVGCHTRGQLLCLKIFDLLPMLLELLLQLFDPLRVLNIYLRRDAAHDVRSALRSQSIRVSHVVHPLEETAFIQTEATNLTCVRQDVQVLQLCNDRRIDPDLIHDLRATSQNRRITRAASLLDALLAFLGY